MVFSRGLAFGGFGYVYNEFCLTSRDLRAVKEITVHSADKGERIRLELRIT